MSADEQEELKDPEDEIVIEAENLETHEDRINNALEELDALIMEADEIIATAQEAGASRRGPNVMNQVWMDLIEIGASIQKLISTVNSLKNKEVDKPRLERLLSSKMRMIEAYKGESELLKKASNDIMVMDRTQFAELRKMRNPKPPLYNLFRAIAILFNIKYADDENNKIGEINVKSFIASSEMRQKILRLKPEHLEKATIKRVKDFLARHPEVSRQNVYEINKHIAVVEAWLRMMLNVGERRVSSGKSIEDVDNYTKKLKETLERTKELNNRVNKTLPRAKRRAWDIGRTVDRTSLTELLPEVMLKPKRKLSEEEMKEYVEQVKDRHQKDRSRVRERAARVKLPRDRTDRSPSPRTARKRAKKAEREKVEKQARELAERKARDRAKRDARNKAKQLERDEARRKQREKNALEKAQREAGDKAAREKLEREGRERAERRKREKAEREARGESVREARRLKYSKRRLSLPLDESRTRERRLSDCGSHKEPDRRGPSPNRLKQNNSHSDVRERWKIAEKNRREVKREPKINNNEKTERERWKHPERKQPQKGERQVYEKHKTERERWKRTGKKPAMKGDRNIFQNEETERARWQRANRNSGKIGERNSHVNKETEREEKNEPCGIEEQKSHKNEKTEEDRSMKGTPEMYGSSLSTLSTGRCDKENQTPEQNEGLINLRELASAEIVPEMESEEVTDSDLDQKSVSAGEKEKEMPTVANSKHSPDIHYEIDLENINHDVQKANNDEKSEATVKITYVDEEGYTVTEIIETVNTVEVLKVSGIESQKYFGKDGEVLCPEEFSEETTDFGFQTTTTKTEDGWEEDESVHIYDFTKYSKVLKCH